MEKKFHGVIPPVISMVNSDGTVDKEKMGSHIDFLIQSGVNGLFFLGSTGEFSQMSMEEKRRFTSFVVEYVAGRLPVLIGTGDTNTREAISFTKFCEEQGADGVAVINPYYWKLSGDNLFKYYADIADTTSLPMLIYNFPALTGQDIKPEWVLRLADGIPNIAGIKESVDASAHIQEIIFTVKQKHPHFSVLSGMDALLWDTLSIGGDGAIAATANFAPQLQVGIYRAFRQQNYAEAIQLHRRLARLPHLYKLDEPLVNVLKETMNILGLSVATEVLPPTKPLAPAKHAAIRGLLKQAQLL